MYICMRVCVRAHAQERKKMKRNTLREYLSHNYRVELILDLTVYAVGIRYHKSSATGWLTSTSTDPVVGNE